MKRGCLALFLLSAASYPALAQTGTLFENETLRYTVNWPSGLSLGEAEMHSRKSSPDRWEFSFRLDAAVPGFTIADRFESRATTDMCSVEFEKDSLHGKRKAQERDTIDRQASIAMRQTLEPGGGKSETPVPPCARDALAFLYYVRSELSRGRIPPSQSFVFGGVYDIRLDYGGRQTLRVSDRVVEADRMTATVKGKASTNTFEIFFGVDRDRRPVLIRLPLPMGVFSMQLAE